VKETGPVPAKDPRDIKFTYPSFTFVRVKYSANSPNSRFRKDNRWATDYPDSDRNFAARFSKITGLESDPDGKVLELTDPELKRYPFLYLVEPGGLHLRPAEVIALRYYLLGGGFLMADDFWGEDEWENLRAEMEQVFPGRPPREIPIDHSLFHCFYNITAKPQIPNVALGTASQYTGITWEREDAREPHYRGIFDDNGRLMAVFCHNTDLGDGWEWEKENDYYFREFSLKKAYPMGINIVVYALTRSGPR